MKTYLTLYFSSEGEKPSEVTKTLKKMGFETVQGVFDFVYDWKGDAKVEEVIELGNKVAAILNKFNVFYKIETI